MVLNMINSKQHLTTALRFVGLQKIVNIKAALNRGLFDTLKYATPPIIFGPVSVVRPEVDTP